MPTHHAALFLNRNIFLIVPILLVVFASAPPSFGQVTSSPTNQPYAASQPPDVGDIAKWQERQNQNPPSPYTQPTTQQTYDRLDSYEATRNLDSWTKREIATNGTMARALISGPYLSGHPNPFYSNGQLTPNWYVPATWSSPQMNWQGVQSNGFMPSASANFGSPAYNPTIYNPTFTPTSTYSVPRYVEPQMRYMINRDPPKTSIPSPTNVNPLQPQDSVANSRSSVITARMLSASAKLVSEREQALAVSETAGDKVGQMINHLGLAQIFVRRGDTAQALVHVTAAEHMVDTVKDPRLRADLLLAKSAAHLQAGDFERAIADNRDVMPILRAVNDEAGQAETFLSSAWAFQSIGDIRKAIGCYDSAVAMFSRLGDKDGQVRARLGIGSLYQSLGQLEKAAEQYVGLIPIASKEQKTTVLVSIAELFHAAGYPFWAIEYYTKAQVSLEPDRDRLLQVTILTGMGRAWISINNFEAAEKAISQARILVEATSNTAAKASVFASAGELQYWIGSRSLADPTSHFKLALANYSEALPLMRAIGDRAGEIGVLTNSGLVYDARGKSKEALTYYLQSLNKMEELQDQARLEEFRTSIAGQSAGLYARAIQLELELHQIAAAFDLSERARARAFLDQLGNTRVDNKRQVTTEFVEREEKLRRENISIERQLGEELSKPGPDLNGEIVQELQARLIAVRTSYGSLLNEQKRSNSAYAAFESIAPLNIAEAQKRLDPETTIVSYFTTSDRTFAFVITKTGLKFKRLEIGDTDLMHKIATFRDFANESELSPTLKVLYKALIAPLHSEIRTRHLVIVPYGELHELPFAALTSDGRRFLADDYSISYLPSVSSLAYLHPKNGPLTARALVLANNQNEGSPYLASADDEARAVAGLLGTKALLGSDATPEFLKKEGGEYSLIHLISHFEIDRTNPMSSSILLAGGADKQSRLDLAEVYGLSLPKTDLVVLSGCHSQSGKRTSGDDIIGLSRAFLYAGTPSVIASLWSVDDDATRLLMVTFYTRLKQGLRKADALRAAQAEVRRTYPSPYYWAGFVLTGDPGPIAGDKAMVN